jgi:hypothetical protein
LSQAYESDVADVIGIRPLEKLKIRDSIGCTQMHSRIFSAVSPWPDLPLFASGRFENGQASTTSGFNRACNSRREAAPAAGLRFEFSVDSRPTLLTSWFCTDRPQSNRNELNAVLRDADEPYL